MAAQGTVYVASIDAHTVYALDAASGKELWHYVAGGRIDSPPTVHGELVLFGCRDGRVYCVRASDGALVWRFLAAPVDRRPTLVEKVPGTDGRAERDNRIDAPGTDTRIQVIPLQGLHSRLFSLVWAGGTALRMRSRRLKRPATGRSG